MIPNRGVPDTRREYKMTKRREYRMTGRVAVAGILASLTIACESGGDAGSELRSETRDSAGVKIVENGRPVLGSGWGWRVGEEPTVSIGMQEGDEAYQLFIVLDATKLPDGRIVVANSGAGELRIFDASGRYLATWGGVGEGPGEFSMYSPESVHRWPGDSVMASSSWRRQISLFDAAGNHGRSFTLSEGYHLFVDLLAGGTLVAKPSAMFQLGTTTISRQDENYGLFGTNGELEVFLGAQPGAEWYFNPDGPVTMPHPFGRSTVSVAWGDLIVVTPNDRYEIKAYSADGSLAMIVRRDHDLRSPTQDELDRGVTESYADLPEERRTQILSQIEGMPLVESFPAFAALKSDPLGYLWVKEYQLPGQEQDLWTVFDPEGRVQGVVETPRGLNVFEIGEDYILGRMMDDLNVERVQLWPLARAG